MNREGATAPEIQTVEMMLARMRQGIKTEFEISMRGQVFHVRILSLDEVNQIRRYSIGEASRVQGDLVDRNVEMQKATLKLASTLDKGVGPVISDKLMSFLSTDEMNDLFEQYIAVMESVNPSLEQMTEAEFRPMVEALKKNQITWKDLSLKQLRVICTAYQELIQRPDSQTSPPGSSSGGPPVG